MRFSIIPYVEKFKSDCEARGIVESTDFSNSTSGPGYGSKFKALGFTSYRYYHNGYIEGDYLPQYLDDHEFSIFVLKYG